MVMSGIPYWTTDIGGFGGGDTASADFRELVVRWFQWGAFCPLFRLHGSVIVFDCLGFAGDALRVCTF
jgi:alpha-D-xyloside xylohydrolase